MSKRTMVGIRLEATGRQLEALIDVALVSRGEQPKYGAPEVRDTTLAELHRAREFVREVEAKREERGNDWRSAHKPYPQSPLKGDPWKEGMV